MYLRQCRLNSSEGWHSSSHVRVNYKWSLPTPGARLLSVFFQRSVNRRAIMVANTLSAHQEDERSSPPSARSASGAAPPPLDIPAHSVTHSPTLPPADMRGISSPTPIFLCLMLYSRLTQMSLLGRRFLLFAREAIAPSKPCLERVLFRHSPTTSEYAPCCPCSVSYRSRPGSTLRAIHNRR